MKNALIGFSGFVGGTLLKQTQFTALYRSTNIGEIKGKAFDRVLCAGVPAQKWIANREPEADRKNIDQLMTALKTVQCKTFILISTVDVFKNPIEVDERTIVDEEGLHAYGLHRRFLEKFVETHFCNYLIVRLPGLVGPRLRKNVIFDFLNVHHLHTIESRGTFQFYPIVNLWYDIQVALKENLRLIHFTAAPISVADLHLQSFGSPFTQELSGPLIKYDIRTCYAKLFGVEGDYQYSVRETIQAVRTYVQSEPLTLKVN